jgi:hypothetical protein
MRFVSDAIDRAAHQFLNLGVRRFPTMDNGMVRKIAAIPTINPHVPKSLGNHFMRTFLTPMAHCTINENHFTTA